AWPQAIVRSRRVVVIEPCGVLVPLRVVDATRPPENWPRATSKLFVTTRTARTASWGTSPEPSDMPSSVTLLAVGRWPATEKAAELVSPPAIASTPGASVATVFRSDASVGSRTTSSPLKPWPVAPLPTLAARPLRRAVTVTAPAIGWLSGPVTVPAMMSVAAPSWPDAGRDTPTTRQTSRASGPRNENRGVTLRSRSAAADHKARLRRGADRYCDRLRVGTRHRAIGGHAAERHGVVADGDSCRRDAIVGADGAGLAVLQRHGITGREVRPGRRRLNGQAASGRR